MKDSSPPCSVISLPDIDIESQISCAKHRLVSLRLGLSESVAKVRCCEVERTRKGRRPSGLVTRTPKFAV